MRHTLVLALAVAASIETLGGCSGGGGGGGPPGGNLMVTARVVSYAGTPVSGVSVWISGQGPFFTDAAGEVVVQGAPSPYVAVVVDGTSATADYWDGLTRPDPVFIDTRVPQAPFTADIDGQVTGGLGFPTPPNHETRVMTLFAPDALGGDYVTADPATGAYAFANTGWIGNPTSDYQLVGMQYLADASGAPLTFTGFGATVVSAIWPGASIHQDVPLFPASTDTISGTVNTLPGQVAVGFMMTLETSTGIVLTGPNVTGFTSTLSINFPVVGNLAPGVLVFAENFSLTNFMFAWRRNLPVPPTNVTVDVPAASEELLPVNGSTGVDYHTVFQVTPTPGDRAFIVTFSPDSSGPTIRLHTTASSFSIPNLSSFGLGIPQGADYHWRAEAQGPVASLDQAAVQNVIVGIAALASNSTTDAFYSANGFRDFQFAP
jgi:hypothetical protein